MTLRVGIFIERFDASRGGRERSTLEVAGELARRGCRVDVVCMTGQPVGGGVDVVTLGWAGASRTGKLRRFVTAAARHMASAAYDVTHAMAPLPGADVYQLRGGTIAGLREGSLRMLGPVARAVRTVTWPCNRARALMGRLERRVVRDRRTLCLPVSRMVADELRRFHDRTANVRVVFNAVAAPAVSAEARAAWRAKTRALWGAAEEDFVLVCPAMNFRLKGVPETVEAFARFRPRPGPPARLVVLGTGQPKACQRLARRCGVGGDVVFRPAVGDIWPVYAAADAVVLLSWYDPCSRVVLEAATFGVPSITTRFNGAAELVAGQRGNPPVMVVDSPAAVADVAEACTRLADPGVRADCAAACRAVAPHLSITRHVDKLMAIYEEITAP